MKPRPDIVIVGAGIVGAACAWECTRNGLKVLVVDQGPVGGGTTGAGMGHLVAMDDSPGQFSLTTFSRGLWHELAPVLPPAVEYDPCGTLWVAEDEEEWLEVQRKADRYRTSGIRVEVLNGEAVSAVEPALRKGLRGGLRVPDDAVLYPPAAARFFLDRARDQGAEVRLGLAVQSILNEGGVVLADGTRVEAGLTVNAAGPWASMLSPDLPVRKRRGHLVITDRYPGYLHHQVIELGYLKSAHASTARSVAFNVQPRKTGQLLVGSSREFDVEDTGVDPHLLGRMLRRAFHYLPGLRRFSTLRSWTGFRAATSDKQPLIGPSPAAERVWYAVGHEGLGITTAPGTARLLVDQLLGRPPSIPATPFLPARFRGPLLAA